MKTGKAFVRLAALLLTAAMLFTAFAACRKSDEQLIIGKWKADIDFSGTLRGMIEKEGAAAGMDVSDMDFSGISLKIAYTFEKDGSFTAEADEESVSAMVKRMGYLMGELIKKSVQTEDSSIGDAELLAAMGIRSWEDLGDKLIDRKNIDLNGLTGKGTYKLEGGRLKLMQQLEDGKTQNYSYEYTLAKKELKFVSVEAEGMSDDDKESLAQTLPIVFERAK